MIEHQRRDHREVEEEIALIVDGVGADRDRAGAADDGALIGDQRQRDHDRGERNGDAGFGLLRPRANKQPLGGAPADDDAEIEIRATWPIAASASALPWPKR